MHQPCCFRVDLLDLCMEAHGVLFPSKGLFVVHAFVSLLWLTCFLFALISTLIHS